MRKVIRRRSERGNSALEFAISFTFLWLMFSGVFTFGYTTYLYNGLATQVADASRFAARDDFSISDSTLFVNRVKNVVVYGNPAGTGSTLVPGLTTANVNVTWDVVTGSSVPKTVTISIVNYAASAVFQSFTFNNKPSVTVQYVGIVQS